MKIEGRIFAFATALASLGLAGCVSDPTYGTGKSASSQLLDDMSSIATMGPKRNTGLEYKPRPDLVKPVAGQKESLPQPQQSVARAGDPSWPESPEERRKRLRAEMMEKAAEQDDVLMEKYLDGTSLTIEEIKLGLRKGT
ncbi:MAG: hypothetical protein LBI75_01445, partial [Brucellaceae bacterium]|nr:hypothetical protein [Brucellaceae bacterium]